MQQSSSRVSSTNQTQGYTAPLQKRSYMAMVLSAIIPGLGQLYLKRPLKGTIIFIVFIFSIGIFYINSYPVKDWNDLLQFKQIQDNTRTEDDTDNSIHLWTLDNGDALMFRPSWILKVTSLIQGLVCLVYAAYDAWKGRPVYSVSEQI